MGLIIRCLAYPFPAAFVLQHHNVEIIHWANNMLFCTVLSQCGNNPKMGWKDIPPLICLNHGLCCDNTRSVCFFLSKCLGALQPCGRVCYSTQRPRLLFPVSSILAEDRAELCVFIQTLLSWTLYFADVIPWK